MTRADNAKMTRPMAQSQDDTAEVKPGRAQKAEMTRPELTQQKAEMTRPKLTTVDTKRAELGLIKPKWSR